MRVFELDASNWKSIPEFYAALFAALGTSYNHSPNPNAMLDVMVWDSEMNEVKPPYTVRIVGTAESSEAVRQEIATAQQALSAAKAETIGVHFDTDLQIWPTQ